MEYGGYTVLWIQVDRSYSLRRNRAIIVIDLVRNRLSDCWRGMKVMCEGNARVYCTDELLNSIKYKNT